MANVSEYYMKRAVCEERIRVIKCMLEKEYSEEKIFDLGYTEEEIAEAQSLMTVTSKLNPMQELLQRSRMECLSKNPMTMEEIDKVIHGEE